jgi:hypothetical protein
MARIQLTAAPLAVRDKIIVGAAGATGRRDFIAASDGTGKMVWRKCGSARSPAARPGGQGPGRPADRRRGDAGDTYDTTTPGDLGTGNPVPMFDATIVPATTSTPTA